MKAMPVQEAAVQDALGGAVLGGATGAIIGGALGGGRGAAVLCRDTSGSCRGCAAPPPPARVVARDGLQERMLELRAGCEDSDRRACVRLGILIAENRARRAAWRRDHPEVFLLRTLRGRA